MLKKHAVLEAVSRSVQDTHAFARAILEICPAPVILALHGELGSGKTCFVQGLAAALGVTQPVTSPTFKLVNEYQAQATLCHIDLYRIHTPAEALALGLDDYLEADAVTAIEWAERAANLLPPQTVHIRFAFRGEPDERLITATRLPHNKGAP